MSTELDPATLNRLLAPFVAEAAALKKQADKHKFFAQSTVVVSILVNERNEWRKLTLGTRPDLPTLEVQKRLTATEKPGSDEASGEQPPEDPSAAKGRDRLAPRR